MFRKIKDLFKRKPTWAERVSASIKTYEKSRNADDLFDVFVSSTLWPNVESKIVAEFSSRR